MNIAELVKQASASTMVDNGLVMKTAHEQGIQDAANVMKVASYTGDVMGNQAFSAFQGCLAASLGLDPENAVVKEASIADMIDYAVMSSFEKIAESYSSQSGGSHLKSTEDAAADQLREEGKAHAMLAFQAANDAVASVDMGDPNTATQSMATAGQNMILAQQAAAAVADPELEAQVAEASQAVTAAAQRIQGQ